MGWLKVLLGPITSMWEGHQNRKATAENLKAKLTGAKQDHKARAGFNDQEWEMLGKAQSADSWTDEYVTVIITLPLVLVFVCTFVAVLFAKPELLQASDAAIASVKVLLPGYDGILEIVVLAAVGIKGVKAIRK